MKFPIILLVLISTLLSCDALNNRSEFNRVDCGETVGDDYFFVLDSRKNRLSPSEFQILMRSGSSPALRTLTPTSKGCISKDLLKPDDTLLVKAPARNEAQAVRAALINGRTSLVLQTIPDKKPIIHCNYNLVDSTLFLNQFINFNDATFLEFYNIAASISSSSQVLAETGARPLLNAGTYDLRPLIRGKVYDMDLQVQDFVFSNGSLISTPCELDMDIPNLSAKLGDEIKEYRNYFGQSYGVVDEGYELNFYIEGGLKTVSIDYCLLRIDPEKSVPLQTNTSCSDLGLPIQSYASSEKGERLDKGFWLVLYRYKKGLLTKPWVAQKIMVRKVCETALFRTEELDQNFCTDLMGNISAEGLEFKGLLEIKYTSVLLGQLYVGNTNYQSIHLPNLEFASQIDIQYNNLLERIRLPRLSQVSLGFNIAENTVLQDIKELSSLERVGNGLNVLNTNLQSLAGLENLKAVGSHLNIVNNPLLNDLTQLQSLEFIGGDLVVENNEVLTSIEGLDRLNFVDRNIRINSNALLETVDFARKPLVKSQIEIAANPKLDSLKGFESIRVLDTLYISGNTKLSSFGTFKNLAALESGLVIAGSPEVADLKDFESLKQIKSSLTLEGLAGLKSFEGLQDISQLGSLIIKNNGTLSDLVGLDSLQSLNSLQIIDNASLQSTHGLTSLSSIDQMLTISGNPSLKTLMPSLKGIQQIKFVTVENNIKLKDMALLRSLETADRVLIKFNAELPSLSDLKNLKTIHFDLEIANNNSLENIEGLNLLTSVGRDFVLDNNWSLTSLNGLSSLSRVGGNFNIISCGRLTTLQGLESLKTVSGRMTLRSNLQLQSLQGLDALETSGGFLVQYSNALKDPCSFFKDPTKVSCRS